MGELWGLAVIAAIGGRVVVGVGVTKGAPWPSLSTTYGSTASPCGPPDLAMGGPPPCLPLPQLAHLTMLGLGILSAHYPQRHQYLIRHYYPCHPSAPP
jgi:hypothetical protein